MPRCSYHPNVETDLTCTECGKPICPKEMVLTPVGYKCPEHARPQRSQYTYIKPKQAVFAVLAAAGAGLGGAAVLAAIGFGGLFGGIIWGMLTAEAVRRASGGHRGGIVAGIAASGVGLGWVATLPFGGLWFLTPLVAAAAAVVQLTAFGR